MYRYIYTCIYIHKEASDNLVAGGLEEYELQLWQRNRFNHYTARFLSSVDFIYIDLTVTFLLVTTIMLIGAGDTVIQYICLRIHTCAHRHICVKIAICMKIAILLKGIT